jgi:hypothetical protein
MSTIDHQAETDKYSGDSLTVYPILYITERQLNETAELLASFAEETFSEGVVYWFGFECGNKSVVTTLIVPEADSSWGCITTTPEANARALEAIVGTPLVLLGQAHSHPKHGVRHSPVDDRDTFANFDGAISVVVPYYGRKGLRLRRCGVHRHLAGRYRVVPPSRVGEHVRLLPAGIDLRLQG